MEKLYRLTKPQSVVTHDHVENLVYRENNTGVGQVTEENKIAFAGYLRELIAQFCDLRNLFVVVSTVQTESWLRPLYRITTKPRLTMPMNASCDHSLNFFMSDMVIVSYG